MFISWVMLSSCSSSGTIPDGQTRPQEEGLYPQFPNLPAQIDGRVVACVPQRISSGNTRKFPAYYTYMSPTCLPGLVVSILPLLISSVLRRRLFTLGKLTLLFPVWLNASWQGQKLLRAWTPSNLCRLSAEVCTSSTSTPERGGEGCSTSSPSSASTSKRGHA